FKPISGSLVPFKLHRFGKQRREQGYPRDLAERALAHLIQNKVEAAYHRTDLLDKRRPMMDAWAQFVSGNLPAE
ncbi:hypothetical protein ACE1BH_25120, partial [Aeromonas jandaei]